MAKMTLELVPASKRLLDSDIPQGTAGYTRDGVSERLSYCLEMVYRAMTRWRNKVHANVNCILFKLLSSMKLRSVAFVGSSWGHG